MKPAAREAFFRRLAAADPEPKTELGYATPFQLLVAVILSAQATDKSVNLATGPLFRDAPTPQAIAALGEEKLVDYIKTIGLFRTKAKNVIATARLILEKHGGEVPHDRAALEALPGVGRKTANLVRSVAFKKPAICVDTHVHRITNIWRYVDTANPLQTEMALRATLPERHWIPINSLLVAFGQSICRPVSPHCDRCPLQGLCPQHGVRPRKPPGGKMAQSSLLKCISWNVNGIRAVEKKGFVEQLLSFDADIVALQETKAQVEQLSPELKDIPGYTSYWHSAVRKGYSGVAIYSRVTPLAVRYGLGEDEFDCEGRVLTVELEQYFVVNIYFPNSGDELKRLDFKLRFNASLLRYAETLRKQKPVVLCGDFNVAHKEIDLANPKANVKNAGFTPEERSSMDGFVAAGYVDTFRIFNQEPGQYTWWSYRFNARAKNIGWRIDYFCVSEELRQQVHSAAILAEVAGSDHCPVSIELAVEK